jgi:hypothetical protein
MTDVEGNEMLREHKKELQFCRKIGGPMALNTCVERLGNEIKIISKIKRHSSLLKSKTPC